MREEPVPEVLARLRVPGPVRDLGVGKDDSDVTVLLGRVAPNVPVVLVARRVAGLLKPRVLVRGVVQDELGDDPHAPPVRVVEERLEVVEVAVDRQDREVVGRVVAVVPERALQKGQQPQRVHAEPLQVRQLPPQPREVAEAVVVGVEERPHVELVDDGVAVPVGVGEEVGGHGQWVGESVGQSEAEGGRPPRPRERRRRDTMHGVRTAGTWCPYGGWGGGERGGAASGRPPRPWRAQGRGRVGTRLAVFGRGGVVVVCRHPALRVILNEREGSHRRRFTLSETSPARVTSRRDGCAVPPGSFDSDLRPPLRMTRGKGSARAGWDRPAPAPTPSSRCGRRGRGARAGGARRSSTRPAT